MEDDFEPFTETVHRFRYYPPPTFIRADPDEIDVGKMCEVTVIADENADLFERNFFKSFKLFFSNSNRQRNLRLIWYSMQIWQVWCRPRFLCEQNCY
jgi:hypothetical protein